MKSDANPIEEYFDYRIGIVPQVTIQSIWLCCIWPNSTLCVCFCCQRTFQQLIVWFFWFRLKSPYWKMVIVLLWHIGRVQNLIFHISLLLMTLLDWICCFVVATKLYKLSFVVAFHHLPALVNNTFTQALLMALFMVHNQHTLYWLSKKAKTTFHSRFTLN
jgi:hypothetical protein